MESGKLNCLPNAISLMAGREWEHVCAGDGVYYAWMPGGGRSGIARKNGSQSDT